MSESIEVETGKLGLKYLGEIPYDPQVEDAIGNEAKLLKTAIAKKLKQIAKSTILAEKERRIRWLAAKAVIFDYIGTLVNCKGYTMDASIENLYSALAAEGFEVSKKDFCAAYDLAHEKYRVIRYEAAKRSNQCCLGGRSAQQFGL